MAPAVRRDARLFGSVLAAELTGSRWSLKSCWHTANASELTAGGIAVGVKNLYPVDPREVSFEPAA